MSALAPGSTVGILGGGQLARMLALEARRMDYRCVVLDPQHDCPAAAVAEHHLCASYEAPGAASALAELADVVTLDTEHVPLSLLERLSQMRPVYPAPCVLRVIQDRLLQRDYLQAQGLPQTPYAAVDGPQSLQAAAQQLGCDAVLKTRRFGYDGRGQARIQSARDLDAALAALGGAPAVLEAFVPFEREISVVVARGLAGECVVFPVVENLHERGVLAASCVPARVSDALAAQAQTLGRRVAGALGVVGLCVVELFVMRDGALLINEVAARPHNSGHPTWGAADISQFEQHLRAICGLPLVEPQLLCPAAMVNLFGELWEHGAPSWDRLLAQPGTTLHLYGKREPRAGRKMGHVICRWPPPLEQARQQIEAALRLPR